MMTHGTAHSASVCNENRAVEVKSNRYIKSSSGKVVTSVTKVTNSSGDNKVICRCQHPLNVSLINGSVVIIG